MLSSLPSSPRPLLMQGLNFALVLSTAFMLWKGLSILTNSPSPIVVVLSGSMEPAFQRGDILFLWNRPWSWPARLIGTEGGKSGDLKGTVLDGIKTEAISGEAVRTQATTKGLFAWETGKETEIGEIVVYNIKGKDIPIVHRVVRTFGGGEKPLYLLTKGDNNLADDTELYARGQDYIDREKDVIGSVYAYIPFVGYVTILLSEHPWIKTAMLSLTGVMVVLQRE